VRALSVRALAANVVNQVVGVGAFVLPAVVAATLGASAILAYLVCAAAMGLIVLCLAEAGSRVSASGGTYAYVEAAFGPYVGFLAGALFWFGAQMTGSAATAAILADTVVSLVPAASAGLVRAAVLLALFGTLAAANIRGVREGARLVEVVTAAKLAPLVLLVVAGAFIVRPDNLPWPTSPSADALGEAALVLVYAFVGTEGALTASGEIRDPARTVPRAVLLSLATSTALYVAVVLHAAVACAFAVTGTFRALAVLSVVATLLIYLACCLAVLALRRRGVQAAGAPFRVQAGQWCRCSPAAW
jgi:basic amino acid/polyamine antiporter, APA family